MSDMLEKAIVDAEALKEAALKNAEAAIVEKYSHEIKEAVSSLLEQPEEDPFAEEEMGGMEDLGAEGEEPTEEETPDMPDAATEGGDLCPCPESGEVVDINLTKLAEELEGEDMNPDELIDREELAEELAEEVEEDSEEGTEIDLSEEELNDILEALTVDIQQVPSGVAGGGSNNIRNKENADIALAQEAEEEELEEEENPLPMAREKEYQKRVESLTSKNDKLLEKNDKYKNLLMQLKDKLEEVNLSNAKLLYTNRVLGSTSLNERQRKKIVEALSKADSVEEAKVIYETLQSAVGVSRKRAPKSLSEAVQRSSTTLPRRKSETKKADPVKNRWKTLAGLS